MKQSNPPLDSFEGVTILMHWAKAHGFVLNEYHRELANKWRVSTEGVRFASLTV